MATQKHICTKFSSCAYTQIYPNSGICSVSIKHKLLQGICGPMLLCGSYVPPTQQHTTFITGHAMAHMVRCQTLTSETWLQSQVSPHGICGIQNGTEAGISPSTLVLLSLLLHQSSIFIHSSPMSHIHPSPMSHIHSHHHQHYTMLVSDNIIT